MEFLKFLKELLDWPRSFLVELLRAVRARKWDRACITLASPLFGIVIFRLATGKLSQLTWILASLAVVLFAAALIFSLVRQKHLSEGQGAPSAAGATPGGGPQRERRTWVLVVSAFALGLLAAGAVLLYERLQPKPVLPPPLETWGLPKDLLEYGGQLTDLSLEQGCAVSGLGWLPRSLKSLRVNCSPIKSLAGIPDTLASLNLENTGVSTLAGLPKTVTRLDISNTALAPAGLDVLRNASLCRLEAEGIPFVDLNVLPRSLKEVTLQNWAISDLGALPPSLVELSIGGTAVESFAKLPASLRSLRLKSNKGKENPQTRQAREVDFLPQFIRSLAIDTGLQETAHVSDSVSGLCVGRRRPRPWPRGLKALRVTSGAISNDLPSDLISLELVAVDPSNRLALAQLPAQLRRLRIVVKEGEDLRALPRSLMVLDISGSSEITSLAGLPTGLLSLDVSQVPLHDFREVPAQVKELIASFCTMATVTDVPPSVESLNLAGCDNLEMIDNLPPSLVELNVGKTRLPVLPNLSGLTKLKRLDISNTQIRELPDLPEGLEELTLSLWQIQGLKGLPSTVRKLRFVAPPNGPQEDEEGCPSEPSLQHKHGPARMESVCR